jgi:VWFA-related protein
MGNGFFHPKCLKPPSQASVILYSMARKLLLVVFGTLAIATVAVSQQKQQKASQQKAPEDESDVVIRGGVELVNVLASVRTKNNQPVPNLEKGDFHILEDGKEQEIRYFARETDLPLTIGMLIDVSGSMEALIPIERRAGSEFFQQVLRKQDLAFLISFGKDSELLQDSTSSARLLERGLNDLKPSVLVNFGGGPVPTANSQAGTVLYDAIFLAADERLRRETGRKAIILITDGVDTGSRVSRDKCIEAAQKSDAIIYSIYYADPRFGGDEGTLKRMSDETGGRVFRVDSRMNLSAIFKEIQDEMRTQYSITYSPTNPIKDGGYRKLEYRLANKDYKVQARKGYYAVEAER